MRKLLILNFNLTDLEDLNSFYRVIKYLIDNSLSNYFEISDNTRISLTFDIDISSWSDFTLKELLNLVDMTKNGLSLPKKEE